LVSAADRVSRTTLYVGHPLLFHLSYTRLSPWTPIRTVCKTRSGRRPVSRLAGSIAAAMLIQPDSLPRLLVARGSGPSAAASNVRAQTGGARQVKVSDFGRFALSTCVAAAMLAGCGGSQPPIGAPGAMQSHTITTHAAHAGSSMAPEAKGQAMPYYS
jgi:hypothetical protein